MKTKFAAVLLAAAASHAEALRIPDWQSGDLYLRAGENKFVNSYDESVWIYEGDIQEVYYDGEWVQRFDTFNYDKENDVWFRSEPNYSMGYGDSYISIDGDCWDEKEGYWFNCAQRACDWYGQQWACNEARTEAVRDALGPIEDALESFAEGQLEANGEQLAAISANAQQVISNVVEDVTMTVSGAITEGISQLQEQTAVVLDDLRDGLLEGIQDARDEIQEELELEQVAMLAAEPEQDSSVTGFGIAVAAAAATAAGLFVARTKCRKNDEDFQRA